MNSRAASASSKRWSLRAVSPPESDARNTSGGFAESAISCSGCSRSPSSGFDFSPNTFLNQDILVTLQNSSRMPFGVSIGPWQAGRRQSPH